MSEDRLLSVRETADYLGTSPGNIYQWIAQGIGPRHIRIGSRSIRYRLSDLDKYIDARTVEPSRT